MLAMRNRGPGAALGVRLAGASILLAWASVLAAANDGPAKPKRPEVSRELRRIAEGYLKNRGAFSSFRCEFRFRVGSAASLAEALKRGPTLKVLEADCKWIVDGKKACYSRVVDEKARAAEAKAKANPQPHNVNGQPGFIAAIPLSGLGFLTDGRLALRYSHTFAANLMGPNRIDELIIALGPTATPWALGGLGTAMESNPGRWILDGELGTWRFVTVEPTTDGTRLVVECKREAARLTYYFDPGRGFLPVRREYRLNDGRKTHIAMTDVRKCSGGRWFPGRVVFVNTRANGAVRRVQEICLTKLDAKSRIKPEEMFLTLRRGISVLHADNMLSAFRTQGDMRVGINDLIALDARCKEAAARRMIRRAAGK